MARAPLPDSRVHRGDDVDRDAACVDALCAAIERAVVPIAHGALVRETAESGADAWLEQASAALAGMLAAPGALDDGGAARVAHGSLAAHLRAAVPPPTEAESAMHARVVAHAVVTAWVSALHRALGASEAIELSPGLVPTGPATHGVVEALAAAVDPLGLTLAEAGAVLSALGATLAHGAAPELPLGLELDVAPGGRAAGRWVARRATTRDHAADATRGIARSGERVRDDGDEADEAATRAQTPRRR